MEYENLKEINIEKINEEIKELKLNMSKKEDDIKNLINSKNDEIIELNNKIIMQENVLIKYENELKKLDNKIEELNNRLNDNINKKDIKINLLNNILFNQEYQIKEIKENIINNNGGNEPIVNNQKYNFINEILIEICKKMNELVGNENIIQLDNIWLNLTSYEIPQNEGINNIRPFFYFFNELYSKISTSGITNFTKILNFLKSTYIDLIKCSLKGELNSLLSEDITTSKKDILKLIYSPKEFIKQNMSIITNSQSIENEDENECDSNKIIPIDFESVKLSNIFTNFNNFNFLSLPINKSHYINFDNLNINSFLLTKPIITKVKGELKCNYKKISIQKGPFCSELYSKPMILNIMSLVDEDLEAEIHEIYDQESQENNSINIDENIKEIERKDDDLNKYMRVQNYIQAKENIQIEIYLPKNVNRKEIENQIIRRILELKTKEDHFQIEIEIKILTVPLKLLLSCKNYKLEYMNDSYYLKTNELFSNEELIFNIQNYFGEEKRKMKISNKILELKGNTSPGPDIEVRDNKIKINLKYYKKRLIERLIERLNCKIIFYFGKFYEIPIVLNSAIIPSENIFQVYDFLNKCFKSNTLNLIIPNKNSNKGYDYFFNYIPKNKLEINLHF